jgi:hypothetical protein
MAFWTEDVGRLSRISQMSRDNVYLKMDAVSTTVIESSGIEGLREDWFVDDRAA